MLWRDGRAVILPLCGGWQNHFEPERSEGEKSYNSIMDTENIYESVWYLYIAECRTKDLYVGIARDVDRRIKEHNTTNKCRYTRYRKPLTLIYSETCENYNKARLREKEIKKFSRKKKLALAEKRSLGPSGPRDPLCPTNNDCKAERWQSG